ncbi:hypothetical protein ABQE45_18120 [Mycobacteroides chelonae]
MHPELDPATIWRALPEALKKALRQHGSDPLSDALLRQCSQAVEEHDTPVFWRPDPATDFTQYRLHPLLIDYLKNTAR